MNTKLSGAKLVLVKIERVGRNYLPLVEFLHNRIIKFIDYCPTQYLPGIKGQVGVNDDFPYTMFLTLMNEYGTDEIQREMTLAQYCYTANGGVRRPIGAKISLQNSFINNTQQSYVGKYIALMFYYDLPEYSARNRSEKLVIDSVSIPLKTPDRYNVFPDEDRFVGKRFRWIGAATPSITPDGIPGIADQSKIQNLFITLRKGSYNVVENMPLLLFYQYLYLERLEWANIIFDFQNSFITIGGDGTIPNVDTDYIGKSVFLNLQYEA